MRLMFYGMLVLALATSGCGDGKERLPGTGKSLAVEAVYDFEARGSLPALWDFVEDERGARIASTRLSVLFKEDATVRDVNNLLRSYRAKVIMMTKRSPVITISIPRVRSVEALSAVVARIESEKGVAVVETHREAVLN